MPTTLVKLLNRYLELMGAPVSANSGVIDKYIGEAVMAFWGPPLCGPDEQAVRACAAALAQRQALECMPDDVCSREFTERIDELEGAPMPPGWDGIWRHTRK